MATIGNLTNDLNRENKGSWLGPMAQNVIGIIGEEIRKNDTKDKIITSVVDPVIRSVVYKYRWYITGIILFHIILLICLLFIVYSLLKRQL